jgi:hypothetical protein
VYYPFFQKREQSHQNPLFHLINIDKQQKGPNTLVKELIVLSASLIEITEAETLHETFYFPSRENLTYAILFDASLNTLPLYAQTINHLSTQWKKWEAKGVLANDVWIYKGFSKEQAAVVRKIWTLITQAVGNKYQFDALFDATHRDMKAKLEMNEKVVICLDAYCQQAIDKELYNEQVQTWHHRFGHEIVQSIEMPKLLKEIIPFADKLNSYATVRSWRVFLNQQTTINGKI